VTPEELYAIWAPKELIWSPWAIPVPFAQMACTEATEQVGAVEALAASRIIESRNDLAVVVDLPGGEAIRFGLALARHGFRPVPIIDASPGPYLVSVPSGLQPGGQGKKIVVVDMSDLLAALCAGGDFLRTVSLPAHAPPAFVLDSLRMTGEQAIDNGLFDNRWKVFPQDFPSAKFLKQQGIRRVLLVQKAPKAEVGIASATARLLRTSTLGAVWSWQPQEDLAHVLLRWQQAGLEICVADEQHTRDARPIRITEPFRFKAIWYRALEILGLHRSSVGGFGGWPYAGISG
jgi:hypothetical protein